MRVRIVAIEPTPNPNSMKLIMDQSLADGVTYSFAADNAGTAPAHLRQLLNIPGVRSVYQVSDFIALERAPKAEWQHVLTGLQRVMELPAKATESPEVEEPAGRVDAYVQSFRGLPMQVKLIAGKAQTRVALPDRFAQAAMEAASASPDVLAERTWDLLGARYGSVDEVGAAVAAEIDAAYPAERLARLVQVAMTTAPGTRAVTETLSPSTVSERLQDPDWRVRYAAMNQLDPTAEYLEVVVSGLADSNPSVRRLATVYLGSIGGDSVLPHLLTALRDSSPAVRRAAGDCLSDLGDAAAIGPICVALQDPSPLVRWRAARFLYEVGDASAIDALRKAEDDPAFEVRLQVRIALDRIEQGLGTVEPAWKRLTREREGER